LNSARLKQQRVEGEEGREKPGAEGTTAGARPGRLTVSESAHITPHHITSPPGRRNARRLGIARGWYSGLAGRRSRIFV